MFPFLKPAALEKTVDYKWPANTHAVMSPEPNPHLTHYERLGDQYQRRDRLVIPKLAHQKDKDPLKHPRPSLQLQVLPPELASLQVFLARKPSISLSRLRFATSAIII